MKKLNNKGFTLIELLAVLVILIAIMSIAIPSISSSLDRTKEKQRSAKEKIIVSAAELYVTDHKNNISASDFCYISVQTLVRENYLSSDELKNSDGNEMGGAVKYTITGDSSKYEYSHSATGNNNSCVLVSPSN